MGEFREMLSHQDDLQKQIFSLQKQNDNLQEVRMDIFKVCL